MTDILCIIVGILGSLVSYFMLKKESEKGLICIFSLGLGFSIFITVLSVVNCISNLI